MKIDFDKPILREFAAAARLVNELRDTISYSMLVGYSAYDGCIHNALSGIGTFAAVAMGRELFRAASWSTTVDVSAARRIRSTGNRWLCMLSALSVGLSVLYPLYLVKAGTKTMQDALAHPEKDSPVFIASLLTFGALAGASVGMMMAREAGGYKQILRNYRDVMWDYPRKKGGDDGDNTQTAKLAEWFGKFAKRPGTATTHVLQSAVSAPQ